jgi:hypothetical protein
MIAIALFQQCNELSEDLALEQWLDCMLMSSSRKFHKNG